MRLSGVLLSVGVLLQGAFAQQEFLNKLPACAVCLLTPLLSRRTLI
jgi:hypothetical protein